jgi:hypothetical protein
MNNELWLVCTTSHITGTRTQVLCDAVRSRDGRCVISGEEIVTAIVEVIGGVLRLRISFRWLMKVTGMITISAAGLQFPWEKEEPSILCRIGYHLRVVYTSYLIIMLSRLTLMSICFIFCVRVVNNYFRTITKSCFSPSIRKISLVSILIKDFLMIPNHLSINFYVSILGRLF